MLCINNRTCFISYLDVHGTLITLFTRVLKGNRHFCSVAKTNKTLDNALFCQYLDWVDSGEFCIDLMNPWSWWKSTRVVPNVVMVQITYRFLTKLSFDLLRSSYQIKDFHIMDTTYHRPAFSSPSWRSFSSFWPRFLELPYCRPFFVHMGRVALWEGIISLINKWTT